MNTIRRRGERGFAAHGWRKSFIRFFCRTLRSWALATAVVCPAPIKGAQDRTAPAQRTAPAGYKLLDEIEQHFATYAGTARGGYWNVSGIACRTRPTKEPHVDDDRWKIYKAIGVVLPVVT